MSARRGSRLPLGRARAAVLWERVWPLVLPVFAVLGSFLAVALADLLPRLPGWLHVLVLASFAAALAWTVRHAFRGFRPVTDRVARHRLEVDNGLRHRPLTALVDHLASGAEDPRALVLWHAHLTRMAFSARKLRIRLPAPGVAGRDIYGLRAVVLLLLVVTFIAGHGDVAGRLGGALVPKFRSATEGPVGVDVWITPPAYTRLAPMFLDQEATSPAGPLRVPTGSAVLAQVSGVEAAPRLKVGAQETAFTAIGSTSGPGTHRVESVIDQGTRLAVEHDGRELAAWPMEVIPDSPPRVSFAAPPAPTRRSHLRLEYEAVDDYGLASVVVEIRRADGRNVPGGEDTVRLELPLAALGAPSAKGRSVRDLTPHPWAGLPVLIRLVATDGRDQTGTSEDVGIVLPERVFNHPVARAIIEQRKKLSSPSPEVRARVTVALNAIAGRPDLFDHDTVVFLALSVAQSRLMRDERAQAIPSVQRLLWDTALRIEDGEISIAERRLMRAQERLMQALRDGVENPELERLMDELQRAMEEYMEALAEQFLRQGAFDLPMLPDMEIIARDDLQQLIDRARELARMGNMDAARRMLSELRRMLENLRAGIRPGGPSRGYGPGPGDDEHAQGPYPAAAESPRPHIPPCRAAGRGGPAGGREHRRRRLGSEGTGSAPSRARRTHAEARRGAGRHSGGHGQGRKGDARRGRGIGRRPSRGGGPSPDRGPRTTAPGRRGRDGAVGPRHGRLLRHGSGPADAAGHQSPVPRAGSVRPRARRQLRHRHRR